VPNEVFTHWNLKFLYGEAFGEPSVFELTDEFRGNSHLVPEEIKTYEMISQFTQGNQNGHWQAVEHTASNKWNIGFNLGGSNSPPLAA
jgi:outer membrane cobalamin receptor